MHALAFFCVLAIQEPDVEALLSQLEGDSIVARDEAAKALIEAGEKAVPKLKARHAAASGELRKLYSQILEGIAIPKKLRGVLPPITRVNLDAADRPLKEVLEDFQAQTRIPMKLNRLPAVANISVRIKEAAPLEALDAICKAANIGWGYPSYEYGGMMEPEEPSEPKTALLAGPEIHFSPGYHDLPRLFIRHYLVELHEIVMTRTNDFRKGSSRGVLNFGMHWPAGVSPYRVQFEVTAVVDDRGNQLFEGHDDRNEPKGPRTEQTWGQDIHRLYHRYRFRLPEKGVKAIATIRGAARFQYLVREKKVIFDAPEKSVGVKREVEGVTAEFVEMKPVEFQPGKTYLKGRLEIKGRGSSWAPRIHVKLADGRSNGIGAVPVGEAAAGVYDVNLYDEHSKIVSMEVVVESTCEEDTVEFEYKNLPIP